MDQIRWLDTSWFPKAVIVNIFAGLHLTQGPRRRRSRLADCRGQVKIGGRNRAYLELERHIHSSHRARWYQPMPNAASGYSGTLCGELQIIAATANRPSTRLPSP